jgi:hypothetical protein
VPRSCLACRPAAFELGERSRSLRPRDCSVGVETWTVTNRSPRPRRPRFGIPAAQPEGGPGPCRVEGDTLVRRSCRLELGASAAWTIGT